MGLFRKKKQDDMSVGADAQGNGTAESYPSEGSVPEVCVSADPAAEDSAAESPAEESAEGHVTKRSGITVEDMFKFLKKEGFLPRKDESDETSIEFKYQGTGIRMEISDGDYIRLMTFFTLDPDDVNYFDILIASSQVMLELRMVKVVVGEKWIMFSIETMVSSVEEYSEYFIRYLDILVAALSKHREVYSGYQESRRDGEVHSNVSDDDVSPLDKILQEVVASQANNPMKN